MEALERLCVGGLVQRALLRLPPERREAVITAAVVEAGERGPGQMKIKEVARRADVPVGSIYQYFGNRETLIRFTCAVAAERLEEVLKEFGPPLARMPFERGLKTYVIESIAWCRGELALLRLYAAAAYSLASGASQDDQRSIEFDRQVVEPIAIAMQDLMRSIVLSASERGELRATIDPERVCRLVNVLLVTVVDAAVLPKLNIYYRLYDEAHAPDRLVDTLVDLVCRGIARVGAEDR